MAGHPIREPGAAPATIDFDRNQHEYADEIRTRVARMVEWSLRTGKPVGEQHMRRLGPDGQRHFHRQLALGMSRQITMVSRRTETAAAREDRSHNSSSSRTGANNKTKAGELVVPINGRAEQHRLRKDFQRRASKSAWLLATVLTLFAVATLHLLESGRLASMFVIARSSLQ